MRMMKLAMLAMTALLFGSVSAHAITVKKKRDTPGEPADVWKVVGDFCAIEDWHPAVAQCEQTQEGDIMLRTLTLKDGSEIKEKLTDKDETSYSYEIIESTLPVKNYKSTLSVEEDEDTPGRSEVHWDAIFDPQGASQEDAKKKIADILEEGIAGMKKAALTAYDAKQGDK
jgi:Polyketide cyclase / dehydrase and lipid transport